MYPESLCYRSAGDAKTSPFLSRERRCRAKTFTVAAMVAACAFAIASPAQPQESASPSAIAGNAPRQDDSKSPGVSQSTGAHAENSGAQNPDAMRMERQKEIAEQTANLLQLARELKAEVDKTDSDNALSAAAFRKADAIERLTHNVKDKSRHAEGKR